MKRVILLLVLMNGLFVCGADKDFVKGTLTDILVGQRTVGVPSGNGTVIAQHNLFGFCQNR